MTATGPRYSRDSLLSLFTPTAHTYDVQQRLCQLGLWTVCRLADHNNRSTVYLRRHRGHHAGRPRRPVHRRRPVGIGAFIVSVPRHGRDDARSAVRALANSTPLEYRALLRSKREQFWRDKVDAEKLPRQLWRSVDTLLGRGRARPVSNIIASQF